MPHKKQHGRTGVLSKKHTQIQKQNVVQKVVIKLDREKKKSQRKKRYPKRERQVAGADSYQQPVLSPNVIYQSLSTQYLPNPNPTPSPFVEPVKIPTINPLPRAIPFLEDIGTVGTEGRVEILDVPTKKEQLQGFMTPVPYDMERIRQKNENLNKMFDESISNIQLLKEPSSKATRRNKQQMSEARQMEREDIASINLGLSQFNPQFEKPQINEKMSVQPSESVSQEKNIPSTFNQEFQNPPIFENLPKYNSMGKRLESLNPETMTIVSSLTEPAVTRNPREGSWNYWIQKYKEKFNENISEYKAKKQFGTKENFVSHIMEI